MHVWYVDAGIEDTPEPVYTHCLVLSWDRPPFREMGNFFRGGALPVMRPLSKFTDSCLHSCCRTEEIKFSIKAITSKPVQNLWLFYKIEYKTLSIRRTFVYYNFSPQKENTCDIKKYCFSLSRKMREISTVRSESVRLIENAWVSREMRETWQICKGHGYP